MTFLEEMAALASELCEEFGEQVTITWPDGGTWTGKAAVVPVSSIPTSFRLESVAVQAEDRLVIAPAGGNPPLSRKPEATGVVTIGGGDALIFHPVDYRLQGGVVAYAMLARGVA